uniref:Glycosyltransferase family 32 protein n=1 Tax=Macrostomum lignano TaxID=282301 RepID=A0A1I8IAA9_9PLAT
MLHFQAQLTTILRIINRNLKNHIDLFPENMLTDLRAWPKMFRVAALVLLSLNLVLLITGPKLLKHNNECVTEHHQQHQSTGHQADPVTTNPVTPVSSFINYTGISGIPKILHYVFKSEQVFDSYKPFIKSCLDQNPDWQVLFWSDSHSEKLIADHYARFIHKYRSYRDRLEKSDSVRYMILHKFGGVYLDMDVECRKPFSRLFTQPPVQESLAVASATAAPSAFLGEERREQTRILYGYSYCAMNSMMGSRPGHPFFQLAIDRMLGMPMLAHARLTTGPDFLTGLYRMWLNCSAGPASCQAKEPVLLYPARLVSPLMDTSLVNWESKCRPFLSKGKPDAKLEGRRKWEAMGCSQLVANGWNYDQTDDTTVAVHRFLHLGYGNQGLNKRKFNLFTEFPRIKTHYST